MQDSFILHIITILLAAIFAGLSQKFSKNDKLNKVFLALSFMTLFLMMGYRTVGVGVDDKTYARIFNTVKLEGPISVFLNTTMEPGYLIINYIFSIFIEDFQYVLPLLTIIPLFFYYKAMTYEKDNINLFIATFLFGTVLYFYFYGIIRLFIAASIVAYAYRYIFEKKTKKYIFYVLLATTFHYSAIFMLFFVYFSTEKEEKPRTMKMLITLVVIVMPVLIFIASNYVFPNMGERYNTYTNIKSFKFSLDLFDKLPILLVAIFLYKDMHKFNPHIKIYIVTYALATVISIYTTMLNIGRIQWYLLFSICIIFPNMVRAIQKSKYKYFNILLVPLIMTYGILYMNSMYNQPTNLCMHTYSNVLLKED